MDNNYFAGPNPADFANEIANLATAGSWFKPLNPLKEPVEPLDFLIDGFCARGMITVIGASPGAGKSILVQTMLSNHADSILQVKAGVRAVYLTGADSSETEIRRRARSIRKNDGLFTVEMPDEHHCVVSNEAFMNELRSGVEQHRVDILIFDTCADFHEGSTYEAELVNKTMATLRRFIKDTNTGIILITHTKKGTKLKAEYHVEDIADSRIWTSKADFVFGIKSEYQKDSSNLIELQNLKSRSPRPLANIRASVAFSELHGLSIEKTDASFKAELQARDRDNRKAARTSTAHKLREEGKTIREIANIIGIAPATAHKYLKANKGFVQGIHEDPESYIDDDYDD